MSIKDDKLWFDTQEEYDMWYNTPETTDNYQEWNDPPNIPEDMSSISESPNKHIEPDLILANVKLKYGTFEADYFTVYYWISFTPIHVHQAPLFHVILYI